jgi:hypothetical protein
MDWLQFLEWCALPSGISVVVGVVLSVVVEYVPEFSALDPKWKRISVGALSLLIPVLAQALRLASGVPGLAWDDWSMTWWPALTAGFAAFAVATAAHIRKL